MRLDYGGISASRLEVLEERLKDDVLNELDKFGGLLLLHTETHDGSVIPVWEDVRPGAVEALKDIMSQRVQTDDGTRLLYRRIPITSELPPDFTDLSDLMDVVSRLHSTNTPIVLNDQLGRGRSTVASVSQLHFLCRPIVRFTFLPEDYCSSHPTVASERPKRCPCPIVSVSVRVLTSLE